MRKVLDEQQKAPPELSHPAVRTCNFQCANRRVWRSHTSGAMYSGVPQVVLHADSRSPSLLYPKSHSLTSCGSCPLSSTLSSCDIPH